MRVAKAIMEQSAPGAGVAIWWLGQNSFVLRSEGAVIMIDPFLSRPGSPEDYLHEEAPLAAGELGPDAVLCTHDHGDHTDGPFLGELAERWPETEFYGPPESVERMWGAGLAESRTHALAEGLVVEVGDCAVQAVASKTPEVSDVTHFGYVLTYAGVVVYDTGDIMRGATLEEGLLLPVVRAAPDVALITTSPTETEFPDFEEAAALAGLIGARVAVPAHYGCFTQRTFDPGGLAALFRDREGPVCEVIPYCGCYVARAGGG